MTFRREPSPRTAPPAERLRTAFAAASCITTTSQSAPSSRAPPTRTVTTSLTASTASTKSSLRAASRTASDIPVLFETFGPPPAASCRRRWLRFMRSEGERRGLLYFLQQGLAQPAVRTWKSHNSPNKRGGLNSQSWFRRAPHTSDVPPTTRHPSGETHKCSRRLCLPSASLSFAAASMAATEGTDYVKLEKPMVNAEGKLTKSSATTARSASSMTSASTRRFCRALKRKPALPSTRSISKPRASTAASAANSSPCASSGTRPQASPLSPRTLFSRRPRTPSTSPITRRANAGLPAKPPSSRP